MEPKQFSSIFAAVNDVLEMDVNGLASLGISVRGTFVGTLTFKGTMDGKTWFNLDCTPVPTGSVVASTTAVGQWQSNIAGMLSVQVKCSAYTSGNPEVVLRAIPSGGSSGGSSGGGGAVTIADGADVTKGAKADAAVTDATTTNTLMSFVKGLVKIFADVWDSTNHRLQVINYIVRANNVNSKTTITSSTSETSIMAAVAATYLDLYGLLISNTSATACVVTIRDDTAGTTRFIISIPAGETRGFMLPRDSAHNQAVLNKPWTAQCSASVASIEITALAIQRTS